MLASRPLLLVALLLLLAAAAALPKSAECRTTKKRHRSTKRAEQDCGRYATNSLASENRINSGYRAKPGQFPSFAEVLTTTQKTSSFCGGTLIGPRHILTAAHCFPYTTYKVSVKFAGDRVDEGEDEEYQASDWCRASKYHTNYSSTMDYPLTQYDVAVVELEKPVKFNELIQPACLPNADTPALRLDDQQAYVIGTGKIDDSEKFASEPQVLPVLRQSCPPQWGEPESVMCVLANDPHYKGTICTGDSGGPMLALDAEGRQTVFGITSFSHAKCLPLENDRYNYTHSGWLSDVLNMMPEINNLIKECNSSSKTSD